MEDTFPTQKTPKCFHCYATILQAPAEGQKGITYLDQTGRFPYQSSRGNKYLFVVYNYDANAYLLHLLNNRDSNNLIDAWRHCHKHLTKNGHQVQLHILDSIITSTSSTSEGVQTKIADNYLPPTTHPTLYAKQKSTASPTKHASMPTPHPPSRQSNTTSEYNIDVVNPTKFKNFLRAYVKQHKPKSSPHSSAHSSPAKLSTLRHSSTLHRMRL